MSALIAPHERSDKLNAEQVAWRLGLPNVQALKYAITKGTVPEPEFFWHGEGWWFEATVAATVEAHIAAVANTFRKSEPQGGGDAKP
jgi:hypothetical protein